MHCLHPIALGQCSNNPVAVADLIDEPGLLSIPDPAYFGPLRMQQMAAGILLNGRKAR